MKILFACIACIISTSAVATPVTFAPDLTKFHTSNSYLANDSTPGTVIAASQNSVTLRGASGPLMGYGSATWLTIDSAYSLPMLGTPTGQLPASVKTALQTAPSNVDFETRNIDIRSEISYHGIEGARGILSRIIGIPLSDMPTFERLTFSDLQPLYVQETQYSIIDYRPAKVITSSFDITWAENDIPDTHKAIYVSDVLDGAQTRGQLETGHYDIFGRVANFNILNSDNTGGPSILKISNLEYTVEPGFYGTVGSTQKYIKYEFLTSNIPEPATASMIFAGLVILGVSPTQRFLRRRARRVIRHRLS